MVISDTLFVIKKKYLDREIDNPTNESVNIYIVNIGKFSYPHPP